MDEKSNFIEEAHLARLFILLSQANILSKLDVLSNLPFSIYWKDKEGIYLGQNQFAANLIKKENFIR